MRQMSQCGYESNIGDEDMGSKNILRAACLAALISTGLVSAATGWAGESKTLQFDIKPQSLASALNEFAMQSHQQILFTPEVAAGKTSVGVQGSLTAEEALLRVLEGTGLAVSKSEGMILVAQADDRKASSEFSRLSALRAAAELDSKGALESNVVESGSLSKLEEVVVTAQRRTERLIETPLSIGVLSGADLDRGSSRGIADVLNQVGGVSLLESAPGSQTIAIRGVVAAAGTSTTAYYLDEVPFTQITVSQLPDANAFDLSRVEVLRGPQGTLYGASALSGVVRVLTNDAKLDDFEVKIRLRGSHTENGGGNYGADTAVNVPLIPGKLAIRAAAGYSELSGFVDSTVNGAQRINDSQLQSYRLKATYQATEDLSFKLGLSRSKIENGAPSASLEGFTTPFSENQADERVYDIYSLLTEYSWQTVSLLSSTSYLDYAPKSNWEILLGGTNFLTLVNRFGVHSFSQEFRLASRLSGTWQWSAGAIYKDTSESILQAPSGVWETVFVTPYLAKTDSESYATFGELTKSFAEGKFDVTAGARYFSDEHLNTQQSELFGLPNAPDLPAKFHRTTGRMVLAYKPQTDRMFYGSVATGFRSGLNQPFGTVAQYPGVFSALKADSLLTYETGAKGTLLGGALTYDAAVYFMDWKDIQQTVTTQIGFLAYINGESASGPGFDGSVAYRVTDALTLEASVGWNGLELDEDVIRQDANGNNLVFIPKGARPNSSPEWTGSIGARYTAPLPVADMRAVLSSNFSYRSSVSERFLLGNPTSVESGESDDMNALQASIGLENDRWGVDLYGDNLLNDDGALQAANPVAATTAVRLRPRTIGMQVRFSY